MKPSLLGNLLITRKSLAASTAISPDEEEVTSVCPSGVQQRL